MKEQDKTEWVARVSQVVVDDVRNNDHLAITLDGAFDEAAALGFEDGREQALERLRAALVERHGERVPGLDSEWETGYDTALESLAETFGLEL